jgi:hypothetical protein
VRKTKNWYAVKRGPHPTAFYCIKMTPELEEVPGSTYTLSYDAERGKAECPCYAGNKPKCRHRTMFGKFLEADRIGKGWLYDFDNDRWLPPAEEEEV